MKSNYLSACVCMQYHLPLMGELKKVSVKMFVVMELVVSMRESEGVMTVMTVLSLPAEGGILGGSQPVC